MRTDDIGAGRRVEAEQVLRKPLIAPQAPEAIPHPVTRCVQHLDGLDSVTRRAQREEDDFLA